MRLLTFNTFLKQYIKSYSGFDSISIHKISKRAKNDARLRELLFLYCCYTKKVEQLYSFANKEMYSEFPLVSKKEVDQQINDNKPNGYYQRIINSYLNVINKKKYDNNFKLLLLLKIKNTMRDKDISTYRVYKDLSLNPGNINDYFKNSNPNKLSVDTCKKIYNYVSTY